MNKTEALEKAIELLNGDRADDYGDAADNHARIGRLWAEVLGHEVAAWQVAACMAMVKVSRIVQTPEHADSWVDMAGYAGIGAEVSQPVADERNEVRGYTFREYLKEWGGGPGVWNHLAHVPSDVEVKDREGRLYRRRHGGPWERQTSAGSNYWAVADGDGDLDEWAYDYGPFTEVVTAQTEEPIDLLMIPGEYARLGEVPYLAEVTDKHGDLYRHSNGEWRYLDDGVFSGTVPPWGTIDRTQWDKDYGPYKRVSE